MLAMASYKASFAIANHYLTIINAPSPLAAQPFTALDVSNVTGSSRPTPNAVTALSNNFLIKLF